MLADIFGYPVVTMESSEGAALGAAIQALASADKSRTLEEWAISCSPVAAGSRLEPRSDFNYSERLAKQNTLRQQLFPA